VRFVITDLGRATTPQPRRLGRSYEAAGAARRGPSEASDCIAAKDDGREKAITIDVTKAPAIRPPGGDAGECSPDTGRRGG
jgi:hypothetical protein